MGDFENASVGSMTSNRVHGCRIVNDQRFRSRGDALEHRIDEVARIGGGSCASVPQLPREVAGIVVVGEFFDVFGLAEAAQKEMMKHRIMQHGDAGMVDGARVGFAMELVVAEVI